MARPVEVVSIHAPREGCDSPHDVDVIGGFLFQFTHPGRGATRSNLDKRICYHVSIHAPREGCDGEHVPSREVVHVVSIHAPREGCDGL